MKKGSFAVMTTTAVLLLSLLFMSPALAQEQSPSEETTPSTEESITLDKLLQEELPEELYDEMFNEENLERDFELYFGDDKYFDQDYKDYYYDENFGPGSDPAPMQNQDPLGELIASMSIMMVSMIMWFAAWLCFAVPIYVYYALTAYTIGQKLEVDGGWMAWVPILNIYYNVKLAGLEVWWFLLFFVPFANIFAQLYIWMKIAGRRGFEEWVGLLMIVPFVNFFIPGYIAWGTPSQVSKPVPNTNNSSKKAVKKDAEKV